MVFELERAHRLATFLCRFLAGIELRVVLHELPKLGTETGACRDVGRI
jgi:hypothetical protein